MVPAIPVFSIPTRSEDRRNRGICDVLDLRSVTTTGDTDTDVQVGELVKADDEQGLVDLE